MAVELNLLPPEYSVNKNLAKFLGITRMLGVISLAAFLIFAVGVGAFFAISSVQLKNLNGSNDNLKKQISDQSQTENKIVLLKDRIKKIKTALSQPSSLKNLNSANNLVSNLGSDVFISELDIDTTKMSANLGFSSNSSVSNFIQTLKDSKDFSKATVTSFGFSPSQGYLVSIEFVSK